jgi:ABC-type Fe3+ transport system permease subunit
MDTYDDLRDELIAVLAATRELTPDSDPHLADVFMRRVQRQQIMLAEAAPRRTRRTSEPLRLARQTAIAVFAFFLLAPLLMVLGGISAADILRNLYWDLAPMLYESVVPLLYVCVLGLVAMCIVGMLYLERHPTRGTE